MKNAMNQKPKAQMHKSTKDAAKGLREQRTKAQNEKRYYNCGEKNYVGTSCPLKEKGTKCFGCGEFGHIATKCSKKSSLSRYTSKRI